VVLMLHVYFAGPYSSFIPPILLSSIIWLWKSIIYPVFLSQFFLLCPNSFFKLDIPTVIAKLDVVYTFWFDRGLDHS
jgi:hypothetical protein